MPRAADNFIESWCITLDTANGNANTHTLLIDVSKKYTPLFVFIFTQRIMPVGGLHYTASHSTSHKLLIITSTQDTSCNRNSC